MKKNTNLKAGGSRYQHNETLVRDAGLKLKTNVKAGYLIFKMGNVVIKG